MRKHNIKQIHTQKKIIKTKKIHLILNAMIQKSLHMILPTLYIINLIKSVSSYTFSYTRVSNCVLQTQNGCVYWESSLNFEKKLDALCFPEETYLQGRQRKIKISELKVGDEVMVYGPNGITFEKVQAWLHRDVNQWFSYNFVGYSLQSNSKQQNPSTIQNGFYISGMHNIAVLKDKASQIQYEFAQNLQQGDYLYGHGPYSTSETPRVSQIGKRQQMKGVYAPYNSVGNYFITNSRENQQLILVHCFAHVSTKYHTVFNYMIEFTPFWNTQPEEDSYIHPLSKVLKDLFPSVVEIKTLNHMSAEITQNHKFLEASSNKKSSYRYETQNSQRDFSEERKALIIIDKVVSMVETFV